MPRTSSKRTRTLGTLGVLGAFAILGAGCGAGSEPSPTKVAEPEDALADDEEWVENSLPVIEWVRLEPSSPAAGTKVTANVRANDPDGDEIELGFHWLLNGRAARVSGSTMPLGSAMKGDSISVTVTASDGWDESNSVSANSVVGNSPPHLQSITFDPLGTIHRGQRVTARPIARDSDGDPLEFTYTWWVNENELSNRTDVLDTSRLKRGDEVRVRIVASDGYSRSNEVKSDPIRVENSPPKITSTPQNLGSDGVYRYDVQARDPDGDRRLRFRLENAPAGMIIDPISGALSWTPPSDASGSHTVEVVVDDLQGGVASQRFTVVISEQEPEPDPAATTAAASPASPEDDR